MCPVIVDITTLQGDHRLCVILLSGHPQLADVGEHSIAAVTSAGELRSVSIDFTETYLKVEISQSGPGSAQRDVCNTSQSREM